MDHLAHYVRIHLTGAAAGIELFGRGENLHDPEARRGVRAIRQELVEERTWLLDLVERLGASDPTVPSLVAQVGEKIGRLKPNGSLVHRTALTDVVDLEAMHDAVSGKVAGWRALLQVDDPRVDTEDVERLLAQGLRQLETLSAAHEEAARRAFAASGTTPRSGPGWESVEPEEKFPRSHS